MSFVVYLLEIKFCEDSLALFAGFDPGEGRVVQIGEGKVFGSAGFVLFGVCAVSGWVWDNALAGNGGVAPPMNWAEGMLPLPV